MGVFIVNKETAATNILRKLNDKTALKTFAPGSIAREFGYAVGEEIGAASSGVDLAYVSLLLRDASGDTLDALGRMLGVERKQSTSVQIGSQERNIRFYTESGSFGNLNGDRDIVIPSGTLLYDSPSIQTATVVYQTTAATVLPRDSNEVFVSAAALVPGATANIADNTLRYHNFLNYADSRSFSLLVTNDVPVSIGRNTESDSQLRFRIANQVLVAEAANTTSIRLAILGVPGVTDTVRREYVRGIGTSEWIIESSAAVVPNNLLRSAQSAVDAIKGEGASVSVVAPTLVGIELSISITTRVQLSAADNTSVETAVKQAIRNYMNNIGLGTTVVINQLAQVALAADGRIADIGRPNAPFDFIRIYRQTSASGSRIPLEMRREATNVFANPYERVVLEPTLDVPVAATVVGNL